MDEFRTHMASPKWVTLVAHIQSLLVHCVPFAFVEIDCPFKVSKAGRRLRPLYHTRSAI